MKKEFLKAGKIVGVHGIKGFARVQHWCDSPEFFCTLKNLYLNKDRSQKLTVEKASEHGNVMLVKFKGINSIEEIEQYRSKVVYMLRDDALLEEGQYFIDELIGCTVYHADTNEVLGKISDVSSTGANDVWHIVKDDKEYLLPAIKDCIISVDVESDKAAIRPLKGIFDDEN